MTNIRKLYVGVFAFCVVLVGILFLLPGGSLNSHQSNTEGAGNSNVISDLSSVSGNYAIANTFLWKVEKSGYPTSYLLGTLHIGREEDTLPSHVMKAFSKTTTLITEANVMPEGQDIFTLGNLMLDMQGSLSAKLGSTRYNQLLRSVDPSVAMGLDKMRPWAALILIIYSKPDGFSEQFGVDMLLTQKAIEHKHRRVFLEDTIESLKLFTDLPEDKIISLMDILLEHQSEAKRQTEEISRLYRNHQAGAVANFLLDKENAFKYYPQQDRAFWEDWMMNRLLQKRNREWMPILYRQLESESNLIAVGALHLFGEEGLIEQFRKSGYTVTPVMP